MIIVNGYIQILTDESNGFDDKGNPIVNPMPSGMQRIECNYVRNSYKGDGTYTDGTYTDASYTILIALQKFEPCKISLEDMMGNQLGEYEVQQKGITHLHCVGATQLTV